MLVHKNIIDWESVSLVQDGVKCRGGFVHGTALTFLIHEYHHALELNLFHIRYIEPPYGSCSANEKIMEMALITTIGDNAIRTTKNVYTVSRLFNKGPESDHARWQMLGAWLLTTTETAALQANL